MKKTAYVSGLPENIRYDSKRGLFVDPKRPKGFWLFHGTTSKRRKKILKEGLVPGGLGRTASKGYTDRAGKKEVARSDLQQKSVYLSPLPNYAQAFGHYGKTSFDIRNTSDVYAVYVDDKVKKRLSLKSPEASGAFGPPVFSPALNHRGAIPPEQLKVFSRTIRQEYADQRGRDLAAKKLRLPWSPAQMNEIISNRAARGLAAENIKRKK